MRRPRVGGREAKLCETSPIPCCANWLQEHVYQPFEEVLPYELFSVRLSNSDLPQVQSAAVMLMP